MADKKLEFIAYRDKISKSCGIPIDDVIIERDNGDVRAIIKQKGLTTEYIESPENFGHFVKGYIQGCLAVDCDKNGGEKKKGKKLFKTVNVKWMD